MTTTYTIDASVFINAFNPAEAGHADSQRLLAQLRSQAAPLIAPTLLLPEVAAAIRRGRGDEALARQFTAALSRLPPAAPGADAAGSGVGPTGR
jgi:predicted nucleic acid-binding protein